MANIIDAAHWSMVYIGVSRLPEKNCKTNSNGAICANVLQAWPICSVEGLCTLALANHQARCPWNSIETGCNQDAIVQTAAKSVLEADEKQDL